MDGERAWTGTKEKRKKVREGKRKEGRTGRKMYCTTKCHTGTSFSHFQPCCRFVKVCTIGFTLLRITRLGCFLSMPVRAIL